MPKKSPTPVETRSPAATDHHSTRVGSGEMTSMSRAMLPPSRPPRRPPAAGRIADSIRNCWRMSRRRDILQQFLIESAILPAAGGLLGGLLGGSIARLIEVISPLPTRVEWWSVAAGLLVSTGVGLFFGIYP